jgi:hypothetical protein
VADYSPVYVSGVNPLTKTASAAITGGQVVETTTTGAVGPAGAASIKVVGIAANDTASGGRVTVWPLANIEHEVLCTGTITVGDGVVAGAAGVIVTAAVATAAAAGTLMGIATTTGTAVKVRFIGRG